LSNDDRIKRLVKPRATVGQPTRQLSGPFLKRAIVDKPVDEAEFEGLLCAQLLAEQGDFESLPLADNARQSICRATIRRQTDMAISQREAGAGGRNSQIARKNELKPIPIADPWTEAITGLGIRRS
jgi:hypothetical protein